MEREKHDELVERIVDELFQIFSWIISKNQPGWPPEIVGQEAGISFLVDHMHLGDGVECLSSPSQIQIGFNWIHPASILSKDASACAG